MTTRAVRSAHRIGAIPALLCLLFLLPAISGSASAQSPPTANEDQKSKPAATVAMSLKQWAPPDIDAAVPPVRPDVACSLESVLGGVGARLQDLVQNLQQFSATEHIEHVGFDKRGRPGKTEEANVTYVVIIHPGVKGGTRIEEYRNGSSSQVFSGGFAAAGTAAHALILHPDLVGDYTVTCEGLGEMEGRPAWQLRFVQRPDMPARFRSYQTQHGAFPVALKGRAWIDPDSFQIVRMETDLIKPIPELRLHQDHVVVNYAPVAFPRHNVQLWLPQTADIYMDILGQRFHRRHSFSDYELFWVDVKQKVAPKEQ